MFNISENTTGPVVRGNDKVERYKWMKDEKQGELVYLPKSDLKVDETYQREQTNERVLSIARNWSWAACGVLLVGARSDGSFWVFDGGNRLAAANKRSDIKQLPCIVFESAGPKEEAKWFQQSNTNRRPMTAIEKFKSFVITENDSAVKAEILISQTGRSISRASSASTFSCVAALMKCIERDEDAIMRIWPLLVTICDHRIFQNKILEGMHHLESKMDEGTSLSKNPLRARVVMLGYDGLHAAVERASAYYAKGGAKVWALGIQDALNHRARTNKITAIADK